MTDFLSTGTMPDHYAELAKTVRDFARSVVAPVAAKHDEEHSFPYEVVAGMADMGLFGLIIPEEQGGMGLSNGAYARVLYNERVSANQAAHEPFFLGTDAGVYNDWAERTLVISALNPYNPMGFDLTTVGSGASRRASSTAARVRVSSPSRSDNSARFQPTACGGSCSGCRARAIRCNCGFMARGVGVAEALRACNAGVRHRS